MRRPPQISLSAAKGERGTTLTVIGQAFWLRCIDYGVPPLPAMEPARKIRILLKQGDQSTLLTTVDADANLRFSVTITIPANVAIGTGTFTAEADSYPRYSPTAYGPRETIQPVAFEVVGTGQE